MSQAPLADRIYKIFGLAEWIAFQREGVFDGSNDDQRDGFIHFSTADQVGGTLTRHFGDVTEIVIATVAVAPLGDALRWEASRNGALFPHLYAPLPLSAVIAHATARRGAEGGFITPDQL